MLSPSPKPKKIKAGSFGKCGKIKIKPYAIPKHLYEKYRKSFNRFFTIKVWGCWEWHGRIHNGYGCFPTPHGSTKWAHRVSYALFNGPIRENMHIDHKCRNRICVNPDHLQQVTPQENYQAIQRRKLRREKQLKEEKGQLVLW